MNAQKKVCSLQSLRLQKFYKGKTQVAYSSNTNPFQTLGTLPESMDHIFMPVKNNILFPQISEAAE